MKTRPLFIILGLILLVAAAVLVSGKETDLSNGTEKNVKDDSFKISPKTGKTGLGPGDTAPDFLLENLEGQTVSLKDYRGKKVILNFWATWCPPCRKEMPDMQKFYNKNQDSDIEILAVNLTHSEKNKSDISEFTDEYGVTFPILLDEKGETVKQFKAAAIPTTYFIDTEGTVQKVYVGPVSESYLEHIGSKLK
ncbi:peroxiredoxin family protein [Fictibacillus aquaticus]|uniref:Thioredoxin domain-containing protein n=1 Tax=Fictibacillus aquaticus TaxID=2021314 RepID=A0A235FEA8_9BACL|nr:TlpA disulfide reductase family protein [Fictibacillus aquaticus]OYD59651.1 hypothetical protein CGZ90_07125 [Fictibacillus aquaticus]